MLHANLVSVFSMKKYSKNLIFKNWLYTYLINMTSSYLK